MLRGVYSALITPFDEDENIDEKALERLLEWTMGKGISGVFIVSSTGETWALSFEETTCDSSGLTNLQFCLSRVVGTFGIRLAEI